MPAAAANPAQSSQRPLAPTAQPEAMNTLIGSLFAASGESQTVTESEERTKKRPAEDESIGRLVTHTDLIDHLVRALEDDEVTDEQLDRLKSTFGPNEPTELRVKIDHVRSKVDDLEAYTDALEAFISEEGTAEEVLEGLRGDLEETTDEIEGLRERVDDLEANQAETQSELEALRASLEETDETLDDVAGRHSREIAGVDAKIEQLEATVEDEMASVKDRTVAIENRLEDLPEIRAGASRVDELRDRVSSLEGLPAELEALDEELDDFKAFRLKFVEAVSGNRDSTSAD